MFGLFKNKSLKGHLRQTKELKVNGVIFKIRKVNPVDFLDGSKVLLNEYQLYEVGRKASDGDSQAIDKQMKKLKKHFIDVFMCGVVKPALTRKPDKEPEKIGVEEMFVDWGMANNLYEEIIDFSYGKKKGFLGILQGNMS